MLTNLFKLHRFRLAAITVLATLVIYTLITTLQIGGNQFSILIGTTIPILSCLIASLLFLSAWNNAGNSVSKRIWGFIFLGLLLWTFAELIWGYYALILNYEGSYPFVADLFWLVGYFFIYIGFFVQYQTLYSSPSNLQRNVLILVSAVFVLLTIYFVAWPVIVDFDLSNAWESLVNIFYPLADLGLLILSGLILFSLEKGRYSSSVQLILFGFSSMAVSDLGYSYAEWNGIYYPDGLLNLPSFLVDIFYNISYLAIALGMYAYLLIPRVEKRIYVNLQAGSKTKQNILVYIDMQGRIITTSENISLLKSYNGELRIVKPLLSEALGFPFTTLEELIEALSTQGFITNKQLTIGDGDDVNNIWVSGVIWKESGKCKGGILVLQTLPDADNEKFVTLTEDQKSLVENVLSISGTQEQEDKQALQAYFIGHVNLLYSLVDQFSGYKIAYGVIEQINRTSARDNWHISMDEGNITVSDEYGSRDLAVYFSELLKVARAYTLNYVSKDVIEDEMRQLNAQLGEDVQRSVRKYPVYSHVLEKTSKLERIGQLF